MKLLLLFTLILNTIVFPQSFDKETIKKSRDYYYGEASSENGKEAEDIALSRLTKQISVTVSSSFERTLNETTEDLQETVQDILKTYSTATLKNVETIKNSNGGVVDVFMYISKKEVEKIFAERKKLIFNIFISASEYERNNNYAGAIKNYYFALLLLNSIPEQNIVYENINFTTEIPKKINDIIANTKFYLKKDTKLNDKERELVFDVSVFDKKANLLDFSFWDGLNQVNVQVMDGEALFNLVGSSIKFDRLDVSIKYSYYECRNEISTVGDLWNVVQKPSFKNTKQVLLKITNEEERKTDITSIKKDEKTTNTKNEVNENITPQKFTGSRTINLSNKDNCNVLSEIAKQTEKIISVLEKGNISEVKKQFGDDPFLQDKVTKMLKFNKLKIAAGEINAEVNKTYEGWELRKIRIINSYSSINKQAPEYMVLDFDDKGKIYDINFGIMDNLYTDFVEQGIYGNDWGNRQVIVKFVEKYRTAYLSRNIEMLDSLFADEAVIIVGRVLKKTKIKDMYKYTKLNDEQPDVRYMQYTKDEYLKNQSRLFANQKDIYLGYNSFKIMKKNKQDNVYGLSMRQYYQSTTYSDEGYLFLLVDFNKEKPQIYIRSWQPQEWSDAALIKLSNFNLNQ